ncbi:MAG: metallophosphoesterase, partial [bacterium]
MLRKVCFLLALLLLSACSDSRPFLKKNLAGESLQLAERSQRPDHDEVLTFYALGDWGTGKDGQKAVAAALKNDVAKIPAGRKAAPFVLELGDNVYENGLPSGWNNPNTMRLLEQTFGKVYSDVKYDGNTITFHIIPGNHDYDDRAGHGEGFGDVIHQETTAENKYPFWKYYPIDPAKNSDINDETNYRSLAEDNIFELTIPEKLSVNANGKISIIAIDTQVLLQLYQKNDLENLRTHLAKLETLLEDNASWKFIIGHHPIRSHGKHGGFRTAIWWVPPIILATIVDKLFIKPLKDLDSAANRRFQ